MPSRGLPYLPFSEPHGTWMAIPPPGAVPQYSIRTTIYQKTMSCDPGAVQAEKVRSTEPCSLHSPRQALGPPPNHTHAWVRCCGLATCHPDETAHRPTLPCLRKLSPLLHRHTAQRGERGRSTTMATCVLACVVVLKFSLSLARVRGSWLVLSSFSR
jgi:hypothetical protein